MDLLSKFAIFLVNRTLILLVLYLAAYLVLSDLPIQGLLMKLNILRGREYNKPRTMVLIRNHIYPVRAPIIPFFFNLNFWSYHHMVKY